MVGTYVEFSNNRKCIEFGKFRLSSFYNNNANYTKSLSTNYTGFNYPRHFYGVTPLWF